MTRQIRQTLIRAGLEAPYGTPPAVWSNSDALLVSNPSHRILRTMVPRDIWFPHYGASEQMVAARIGEIKFEVEIAGSGIAGVAPPWAKLLRACGFAETVTADTRVAWNPIYQDQESVTIQYFRAGVRYVSRGCRGTAKLKMPAFDLPKIEFIFTGFDTNAVAAAGAGQYDLSGWGTPDVLTDAASGDIRIGGTMLGGGAVTGGTVLASRGLEIDVGNRVEHMELLGGERISITGREVSGKMSTALTADDEVTWRNEINANGTTTLGFNWGATAGRRFSVYCPRIQRVDPQGEDYKGDLLLGTELRIMPTAAGNDDFVLVQR